MAKVTKEDKTDKAASNKSDKAAYEKASRVSSKEERANDRVRSKFTMKLGITSRDPLKMGKLSDAKFKPDKEFKKLMGGKNALAKHFDAHNGDFDTPEEFVRAYLRNDERAIKCLKIQNIGKLKDALDEFYPELKDMHLDGIENPAEMKLLLDDLSQKLKLKPKID